MSDAIKIYHNPRCSKSRETLELLKSNGVDPEVVLYLETPADAATLRELLQRLQLQNFFYERNGQLTLGGDRCVIKLIQRHKQRTHFPIQTLKQKAAHIFRQFKSAKSGA